jgi:hypothetical protein
MIGGVASSVLFAGAVSAIDWNITGFFRQEIAYSIAGNNNELNTMGLVFNDKIVPNITHLSWGTGGTLATGNSSQPSTSHLNVNGVRGGVFNLGAATIMAGANTNSPVNCRFGGQNAIQAGSLGLSRAFGAMNIAGFRGVLCPTGVPGTGAGSDFLRAATGVANVVPGISIVPGVDTTLVGSAATGYSAQGAALNDDINFNLFNSRLEVDIQARFNRNWAAYVKIRTYYDGTSKFTDGQISDHFGNPYWGTSGQLAEWSSPNFSVDIPAAYIDYNKGPLWIRVGNQSIAWGEAYFFRVMDVANGLDLRRHLTLGPGAEEYSDQRIASPAIRVSYTFKNEWEIDAFAQMWSPTILPAINTPYSVIGAGVTLDERDEFNDARGSINFGFRLQMPLTDYFTAVFMYTNRRNPDGVARYAEAPTSWAGTENRFCLGAFNDTNNILLGLGLGAPLASGAADIAGNPVFAGVPNMPAAAPGSATGRCGSPLAPDPIAANSTEYWHLVGRGRLDPMKALRVVVDEWPADQWATREIFGFGQELNFVDAMRTIEGFHSSFGAFRAWVTRDWKREHVLAIGANYLVNADPNSFFDQLLIRGEVSVTPNKKFTDLGLSFNYIEETEVISALIFEKYQRWTAAFPAMYMVAQWMHRTSSDLFGRHLSGTESTDYEDFIDPVTGDFTAAAFIPGAASPRGSDNADYVVFALQQPFPNLIWRFDLAILVDVEGGYLVQPGFRYRPAANWQWDLYANLIEEGGDENDDIMETIDFADEIFLRMTYYF